MFSDAFPLSISGVRPILESDNDLSVLPYWGKMPEYFGLRRQREWRATRCLLESLLPNNLSPLEYDEHGKPFLPNYCIGISHCISFVVVVLHPFGQVGTDIESVRPQVRQVRDKFLTERECLLLPDSNNLQWLTLAWCVKESLYKWHGKKGINIRYQLQIHDIECSQLQLGIPQKGVVHACLSLDTGTCWAKVHFVSYKGHFWATVIGSELIY